MFLPSMGLQNYAPFILISSAISYGFFLAMHNAINLVEDITGNEAILYELSLPIPQWAIFVKFAISTMLESFVISMALIPCGMLVLMDIHAFPNFSLIKFITIFICASIFYGSFALIFTSILGSLHQIDNIWLRIIFPMWYLGCFQFPWKMLYTISPTLAYLDFLNPLTFIMEGGRSATIDSTGSLPFGISCCAIILFATISIFIGVYCMKKRLDCV
jgi:ABC-type polysaccharide/polyol phosphate export permease